MDDLEMKSGVETDIMKDQNALEAIPACTDLKTSKIAFPTVQASFINELIQLHKNAPNIKDDSQSLQSFQQVISNSLFILMKLTHVIYSFNVMLQLA